MTATARINAYRAAVVATIAAAMPALRECEEQFGRFDLDELETTMVRAPAVRVAVLKARAAPQASAETEAGLSCAAFVVTEGRDRDRHAWTIAEAIAVLLHSAQLFGLTRLGPPSRVEIQPLVALKVKQKGVAIIAVEWQQDLRRLGEAIFDEAGHVIEALYLGDQAIEPEAA